MSRFWASTWMTITSVRTTKYSVYDAIAWHIVSLRFRSPTSLISALREKMPLEAVYVYFDTATFDEIERDEKVI